MHHKFSGVWGSSSFFITGQGQIKQIISVSEWLWGVVESKTFTLNLGPHRARHDFFAWKNGHQRDSPVHCGEDVAKLELKFSENLKLFQKSESFHKFWNCSQILKLFTNSEIVHKIWIFFTKSENFPKIWNFSQNLIFSPKI